METRQIKTWKKLLRTSQISQGVNLQTRVAKSSKRKSIQQERKSYKAALSCSLGKQD